METYTQIHSQKTITSTPKRCNYKFQPKKILFQSALSLFKAIGLLGHAYTHKHHLKL